MINHNNSDDDDDDNCPDWVPVSCCEYVTLLKNIAERFLCARPCSSALLHIYLI